MIRQITTLIHKEIKLEFKQAQGLNSILLYVVSTIFVCYLAFGGIIEKASWNALFWIILLFASVNGASKSFVQENNARHIYYYSICKPQSVILSKIAYNIFLMVIIALLSYIIFALFLGDQVKNHSYFLLLLVTGAIGFASTLTMVAAIASRSSNNFALMAVLSFPVIMPLLLSLIKASSILLSNIALQSPLPYILAIATLDLIVIILSYLLFPYLWRD